MPPSEKNDMPHHRLRNAAKRAGYETATALAHDLGMSESTVRSALNGTRALTANSALLYANFLGVSPGWLLYGTQGRAQ